MLNITDMSLILACSLEQRSLTFTPEVVLQCLPYRLDWSFLLSKRIEFNEMAARVRLYLCSAVPLLLVGDAVPLFDSIILLINK